MIHLAQTITAVPTTGGAWLSEQAGGLVLLFLVAVVTAAKQWLEAKLARKVSASVVAGVETATESMCVDLAELNGRNLSTKEIAAALASRAKRRITAAADEVGVERALNAIVRAVTKSKEE